MAIHIPKVGFVEKWKHWVNMEEELLDEIVEDCSYRHSKTTLRLEEVDVLRWNVGEIVDVEKWVV
jgi:hypothetical protein